MNEDNIAWKSDREKFKNQDREDWKSVQWLDVENQHFIVWMRTAGLPTFRKLFAAIDDQDLKAGNYTLKVHNDY